jgi:serine/threonine-protein kinase RsbW
MVMNVGYSRKEKIYGEDISTNAYEVCEEVRNILDILKMKYSLDTEKCFDIKVILCELLQNAIKHGNDFDVNKKIHLDLWVNEETKVLGITVEDQGCGFNPPKKKDLFYTIDSDPVSMDESGRGLFIVSALCDCMEFNATGNAVTVLKKL